MYEICNVMRRFTFRSPTFDGTVAHRVAVGGRGKIVIFCTLSFVKHYRSSQIEEQDEILRTRLHISYIDHFVVPQIFKCLIGAKDVETCLFDYYIVS